MPASTAPVAKTLRCRCFLRRTRAQCVLQVCGQGAPPWTIFFLDRCDVLRQCPQQEDFPRLFGTQDGSVTLALERHKLMPRRHAKRDSSVRAAKLSEERCTGVSIVRNLLLRE